MAAKTSWASVACDGVVARGGAERDVLVQRRRSGPAARRPALAHQGVAHRAQQVADLVLAAQQARAGEHPGAGLLHQVLGLLPRSRPRARGAVQARQMLDDAAGLKPARSSHHLPSVRGATSGVLAVLCERSTPPVSM